MDANSNEPFDGLVRAFHEPKRLAIVSALCARSPQGIAFADLKEVCSLTDGNLNRHLKVLEEAGAITIAKIEKKGGRPRTEVRLTSDGRDHFLQYLDSLERALETAAKAIGRPAKNETALPISPRRRESI